MRHALFASLTLIATLVASFGAAAGHHLESEKTSISKLSLMTGSWSGDIGGPVLEENWTEAKAGSIAALVRITSPESTAAIEIVDIREMDGSLILYIQQWDPGFVASAEAQKIVLDSIGDPSVSFHNKHTDGTFADQHDFHKSNPDQYLFMYRHVIPELKELGATDRDIEMLFVDNPRRLFEA